MLQQKSRMSLAVFVYFRSFKFIVLQEHKQCRFFFQQMGVNTRTLVVTEDETIHDVKVKIEVRNGFPVELQKLQHGSRFLEDGHTLSDYKIMECHTLQVNLNFHAFDEDHYAKPSFLMPVLIRYNDKEFTAHVKPSDDIRSFRSKVASLPLLPLADSGKKFIYMYNGKRLDDELCTLAGYEVIKNSVIELVFDE